jgi:RNA polymerase sigma factor (sigma-70 family)
MDDERVTPPVWIAAAGKGEDSNLRRTLLHAVEQAWPDMLAYSKANLHGAVEPEVVLDRVVDAALRAEIKRPVEDYKAYLFKSFVHKATRLLRRAARFEYLDEDALAEHNRMAEADFPQELERQLQLQEAIRLMDDRTREIYVLSVQGYTLREIAASLKISEEAVRKQYARGVDRVRRIIQQQPRNEPGPND